MLRRIPIVAAMIAMVIWEELGWGGVEVLYIYTY